MINDEQRKLIAAYHDDELSRRDRQEVERLLADDAEAATELQALRSMSGWFANAKRPSLPADDMAEFHATVERQTEQAVALRLSRWFTGVAAAVVVISGSLLLQHASQPSPTDMGSIDLILLAESQQMPGDALTEAPVESQLTHWIVADLTDAREDL